MILSQESSYLVENLSWLVGSLGTVLLDFVVLGQFVTYAPVRKQRREDARRTRSKAKRAAQAAAARGGTENED